MMNIISGPTVERQAQCSTWCQPSCCVSPSHMVCCSERCQCSSICIICVKLVLPCHHSPTILCFSTTTGHLYLTTWHEVSIFPCLQMILFSSTSPRSLSWRSTVLLLRYLNLTVNTNYDFNCINRCGSSQVVICVSWQGTVSSPADSHIRYLSN